MGDSGQVRGQGVIQRKQQSGAQPRISRRRGGTAGARNTAMPPLSPPQGREPSPGSSADLTGIGRILENCISGLDSARSTAAVEGRLMDFTEAAAFAGTVEEISRSLEYLQVVAAHAVARTRHEAEQMKPSRAAGPGSQAAKAQEYGGKPASLLDDGYRNAAEFLRARLRIGISEARRRLALASELLPHAGIAGQSVTPKREELADAIASALVPSRSATIITMALDKVTHFASTDTIAAMERALTQTAIQSDPDFVATIARRWTDAIDQDGPEPTEEALRQLQGAFIRKPRHGLHHVEIFATTEQFETLTTVMNTATNPRLRTTGAGTPDSTASNEDTGTVEASAAGTATKEEPARPVLDRRSRAQRLLDGLVGACNVALATGQLPSNGGLRPQVIVTIDHRDLLQQVQRRYRGPSSGTATFGGPIHPNTIRKIACDADIIPVLLGSESRVLDIGRTTRLFPPHVRKAITARDGGCAFPDCTMPAPWCEAHHVTYWSQGGTTSTENGTLLCSHHHHLVHKEQWKISVIRGVPWFVPPLHVDPGQTPQRNHHRTPLRT